MAHYGEIIDNSYVPRHDKIYPLFIEYFGNLSMTKIKTVGKYSMYAAKIHCLLGIESRYVVAFIDEDKLPLGNVDSFSNLKWLNLQTRTLADIHNIPPQTYRPRRLPSLMKKIEMVSRTPTEYVYRCDDYPIQITMIPKKGSDLEYQPKGTIVTALETFQTIVNLI